MANRDQLALRFPHRPAYRLFLPADSNAQARAWLGRAAEWPDGRLALWGEAGCGKSHLLRVWAQQLPILEGAQLATLHPPGDLAPGDLAIDDADHADPHALLHLLNGCAEAGHRVVLAGRLPPARWQTGLADLDSRLRAMLAISIAPPEDSLLEALLAQLLAERQMEVSPGLLAWLCRRAPRTAQAMRQAAELLDIASLAAHGPVTRTIAAEIVAILAPDHGGDEDLSKIADPPSPGGADLA